MNRMSQRVVLIAVLGLFGLATASADTLNAVGGSFFGGWTANTDGAEFWDNISDDGLPVPPNPASSNTCNIGYWMTGTQANCIQVGGASAITPTGTWDYLGATGNPDANVAGFTFTPSSSGPILTTLQVEVAGLRDSNIFGYYNVSDGILHQLFAGTDSPQLTTSFTPTGEYGFYLQRVSGPIALTGTDAAAHFALFSNVHSGNNLQEYFIGVEDNFPGSGGSIDLDFNDVIVHVIVPEPGFFGILAMSAAGLFVAYRRRRNSVV
jgi:hypothetical protein